MLRSAAVNTNVTRISKHLLHWCSHELHKDTINAYIFVNTMLFTKENTYFLDILRQDKRYSARWLLKEFHFRKRSCLSHDWPPQVQRLNDFLHWQLDKQTDGL